MNSNDLTRVKVTVRRKFGKTILDRRYKLKKDGTLSKHVQNAVLELFRFANTDLTADDFSTRTDIWVCDGEDGYLPTHRISIRLIK